MVFEGGIDELARILREREDKGRGRVEFVIEVSDMARAFFLLKMAHREVQPGMPHKGSSLLHVLAPRFVYEVLFDTSLEYSIQGGYKNWRAARKESVPAFLRECVLSVRLQEKSSLC